MVGHMLQVIQLLIMENVVAIHSTFDHTCINGGKKKSSIVNVLDVFL